MVSIGLIDDVKPYLTVVGCNMLGSLEHSVGSCWIQFKLASNKPNKLHPTTVR